MGPDDETETTDVRDDVTTGRAAGPAPGDVSGDEYEIESGDWLRTPFCRLFGVSHPIVQTGMGWVSGPELTSATC